jgi:hypothetical protein
MKTKHIITTFIVILNLSAKAQEGKFIDFMAIGHFSNVVNDYDSYYGPYNGLGYDFEVPQTFTYGGQLLYTQMSEGYMGFKTGLSFLNYAQDFSSRVELADDDSISYNARLNVQQFSIPLLANFAINSGTSTDRVYFNMNFGFQLNYLTGADYSITTDRPYDAVTDFEFNEYFHRLGASYILGLELKIALGRKEKLYLIGGVHYDKTIGGIEKREKDFGQEEPRELVLPLGPLKDFDYDIPNERMRNRMKNETLALRFGISYKLFN